MNQLRSQLESALDEAMTDESLAHTKKKMGDLFNEFHADFEDRVRTYMSYNLAVHVEEMANEAIEAILNGDEETMRKRLHCVAGGWTGRDKDHPVIHGRLFETGAIELRKKIVEAHAELIKNERILDLEDQVKSLVQQVNKAEREKQEQWERVREYMPR